MTGNYVTAVGGGGRTTDVIHTDARALQNWEKFALVPVAGQPRDVFAIRTFDGHYLTAVGGGGRTTDVIHTDATVAQGWEWFRFTCGGLAPDGTMTFAPTGQGAGPPLPTIRCGLGIEDPAVRSIRGLLEVTSIGETVCKFKDTDTPAPVLLLDMSHTLFYFGTQADNDRQVTLGLNNVATEPSIICTAGLYSIFASTVIFLPPGYPPAGLIFTPDSQTTNIDRIECLNMPDYNGLAENDARSAIQQMGLTLGTITRQVDNTVPAGTVIAQSPPAGSPTVPGTTVVNLVLASNTTVPNLLGMDERLARITVRAVGLVVGSISRNNYPDVDAGIVAAQNPAPGSVVAPGSAVHIAISLGPG